MLQLGETRSAKELGYKTTARYIWAACIDCGKERWTQFVHGQPSRKRCNSCAHKGFLSAAWKGGTFKKTTGYIMIQVLPDDFFYSMADRQGYVPEHRLVMAKHLGRCLHPWEIVHHKNHIRDDNPIENLQLVSDDRHMQISILETRIAYLEKKLLSLGVSF